MYRIFKVISIFIFVFTIRMYSWELNPDIERKVANILSRMTLDEKIGQMTMVEKDYLASPLDIKNYCLGALLSGGDSKPAINTPEEWAKMIDSYQAIALSTRMKIPLLYGVDAVHGNSKTTGTVIFPHNAGLGCSRNPELIRKMAEITAIETYACGIHWTFAPCIAVSRNERWGRAYESFSEDPELVAKLGEAAISGYQAKLFDRNFFLIATAKHYAGDGGTGSSLWQNMSGIDRGNTKLSEKEFREIHLKPYINAVRAGVKTIMVSFSSWNGKKMHENKYLITDVLKKEFGFNGIVLSDWGAINYLKGTYDKKVKKAINAGIDMVMVPDNYQLFTSTLKQLVATHKIPLSRIDDAVKRILRVKMEMGLFDYPFSDRKLLKKIGIEEHRKVARQCVRESIVLLQNKNSVLPLSKSAKIFLCGKNADNLGYQCGGWTLKWQGVDNNNFTKGTTILQAIEKVVKPKDGKVFYSMDGNNFDFSKSDVIVAVLGETPYAEMFGDRYDLSLFEEDYDVIERIKNFRVPKVLILITGRPLIIKDLLEVFDAILVAWLPGTEGEGVSDVLFGDYKPTGKLSFSWPVEINQLPINAGDKNYKPLFPYGYGLSY